VKPEGSANVSVVSGSLALPEEKVGMPFEMSMRLREDA
jgi:hypothetical protein